jgi:hypothetical protein
MGGSPKPMPNSNSLAGGRGKVGHPLLHANPCAKTGEAGVVGRQGVNVVEVFYQLPSLLSLHEESES